MKRVMLAAFLAAGALCSAQAPISTTSVTRYSEKDLIRVRTKLRFTTIIMLPPGEEISEVSCGDREYWVIDGKDNILHVKPARAGAATNINVVLRSRAVYSFYVDEVGDKATPDLKVVVGPDEVSRLRSDKLALEEKLRSEGDAHRAQVGLLQKARELADADHKTALEKALTPTPERVASFLAKQKFNYACFLKTAICLAAVFVTDQNTYVIGELASIPVSTATTNPGTFMLSREFGLATSIRCPNVSFAEQSISKGRE